MDPYASYMKWRKLRCKIIEICYVMRRSFLGVCRCLGDNIVLGVNVLMEHQGYLSKIPLASFLTQ